MGKKRRKTSPGNAIDEGQRLLVKHSQSSEVVAVGRRIVKTGATKLAQGLKKGLELR